MGEHFTGTAYSYVRFSSAEQERGDSLRRQIALRDAWLERHPRVILDDTFTLRDLGVSAYRGRHRGDKHALGQFLDAVQRGRVQAGSILLLENLDRLSREEEEEAVSVLLDLLRSGLVVVQLEPETVFRKGEGMLGLMRAIMELSRGHQESKRKSVRVAEAWRALQKKAVTEGAIITRRCPSWLEIVDGRFRFKPGALDTIKRIFAASKAGRGARMIASDLLADRVPHFADGVWSHRFVSDLIRCRSVVGEYQAFKKVNGKRVKDGPPVADYFPAAVTEQEWYAVQGERAARRRKKTGGRRGADGWVALFPRVHDARTGERFNAICRQQDRDGPGGRRYRVLQQAGVNNHAGKCVSFPLATFEAALLSRLVELDLNAIMPPTDDGGRVAELSGRLAEIEGRITQIQTAMLDGGEVAAAVQVLRDLDARRLAAAAALAEARQTVASPLHEQWGTLRGLAAIVEADADARVRVRSAIGRLVDRVDCLVVPRGADRVAAVQVTFAETGVRRHYLVLHRRASRPHGGPLRPAAWWCKSFAGGDAAAAFDLRDPKHAADLEAALAAGPPESD